MLIIPEYPFEMETSKFGRIRVRALSFGEVREIRKRIPDYSTRHGKDILVASASVLCHDDEKRPIDGTQLSDAELTEFAEKLLETIPMVAIAEDKPIDELARNEKDNSIDYCGRAIADEINNVHNQFSRFEERPVVNSAIKELDMLTDKVRQSANLSRYYGLTSAADNMRSALNDMGYLSMFDSPRLKEKAEMEGLLAHKASRGSIAETVRLDPAFEPMKILTLPPNPIHKTNEKLDDLAEQVEIFTRALPKHLAASVSALKDVAEQIEAGSKSTAKQNIIMIVLTVISTLAAIISTIGYTMGKAATERNLSVPVLAAPTSAKQQIVPAAKGSSAAKSSQPHSAKSQSKVVAH